MLNNQKSIKNNPPILLSEIYTDARLNTSLTVNQSKINRLINRRVDDGDAWRMSELFNAALYEFNSYAKGALSDIPTRQMSLLLNLLFASQFFFGDIAMTAIESSNGAFKVYFFSAFVFEVEVVVGGYNRLVATGTQISVEMSKTPAPIETDDTVFYVEIIGNGDYVGGKIQNIYASTPLLAATKKPIIPVVSYMEFGYKTDISAMGTGWYNSARIYAMNSSPGDNQAPLYFTAENGDIITSIFCSMADGCECQVLIYTYVDGVIDALVFASEMIIHSGGQVYVELSTDVKLSTGVTYGIAAYHATGAFPEVSVSGGFNRYPLDNGEIPINPIGPENSNWQRPIYCKVKRVN